MKVLVAAKRVVDFNVKVRPTASGADVDVAGLKMGINPFDENALEEALRLREKGTATEIVAVSVGTNEAQDVLRHALAMGADRAILIRSDGVLQPLAIAKLIKVLVAREKPDLILLGKQAIDNDAGQVGPMLAGLLKCAQATFISSLTVDGRLARATREIDGGTETVEVSLPAVLTADLRLNDPRFVKLPNMMMAKKKPIETLEANALGIDCAPRLIQQKVAEPAPRKPGVVVDSADMLIDKLRNEAGVL